MPYTKVTAQITRRNKLYNTAMMVGLALAIALQLLPLVIPDSMVMRPKVVIANQQAGAPGKLLYSRGVGGWPLRLFGYDSLHGTWDAEIRNYPEREGVLTGYCQNSGQHLYEFGEGTFKPFTLDAFLQLDKPGKAPCRLTAGVYMLHICWEFRVFRAPHRICTKSNQFTVTAASSLQPGAKRED